MGVLQHLDLPGQIHQLSRAALDVTTTELLVDLLEDVLVLTRVDCVTQHLTGIVKAASRHVLNKAGLSQTTSQLLIHVGDLGPKPSHGLHLLSQQQSLLHS